MQVVVNSDHSIRGDESLKDHVKAAVSDAIGRFAERITTVEAYLSDANSSKHGARDKRCILEARIAGAEPVVATNEAESVAEAIDGAAAKLERALEHSFGRQSATAGKGPREQDLATVDELSELEKWERERRAHESKNTR